MSEDEFRQYISAVEEKIRNYVRSGYSPLEIENNLLEVFSKTSCIILAEMGIFLYLRYGYYHDELRVPG